MSSFGDNLHSNIVTGDFQVNAKSEFVSFGPGRHLLSVQSTDGGDVDTQFITSKENGLRIQYSGILTSVNAGETGLPGGGGAGALPALPIPPKTGDVYRNIDYVLKVVA